MRKLVTIRKISEIRPIKNADAIELAIIDGWQVVVKKGEFKANDNAIFFEVDSFLPVRPEYEFLRKNCFRTMADGSVGFRLKTITLRGQLSQGLVLPTSLFPNINIETYLSNGGDGLDLLLGVKKWEAPVPACLSGIAKGDFPGFIQKTDQERIQNLVSSLPDWIGKTFELTEKLDGTSCTFFVNQGMFGVCGRNLEYRQNGETTYCRVADKLGIKDKLFALNRNLAIQGEIVGEGLLGNKYKLIGQKFFMFDVFDIDSGKYLNPKEYPEIALKLGIETVPVLEYLTLDGKLDTVEKILSKAEGSSILRKEQTREGIVFKELSDERNRVSFKAISNKFLLDEKE